MCGIIGYTGNKKTVPILLEGLRALEYRGYDSAGISICDDGEIKIYKAQGKLKNLRDIIKKNEKDIKLYALKRGNSKNPLPRKFRNVISKLRRRIETTFYQLNECFNIERVRSNSKIGLQTSLEIKFLCFNIISLIGGHTKISKIINFN